MFEYAEKIKPVKSQNSQSGDFVSNFQSSKPKKENQMSYQEYLKPKMDNGDYTQDNLNPDKEGPLKIYEDETENSSFRNLLKTIDVHKNSDLPEKFGVKALTKDGEIHVTSNDEDIFNHELAHIYQQQTQSIPATEEIGGQKVNLDPKYEKEAEEISENIDEYIPEIVENKNLKTTDMIQFAPPSDEEWQKIILEEAKSNGITLQSEVQTEVINEAKAYHNSWSGAAQHANSYKSCAKTCANWALQSWKVKSVYYEKVFDETPGQPDLCKKKYFDINEAIKTKMFGKEHQKKIKYNILKLAKYCDKEGINSVLKGADENVTLMNKLLIKSSNSEKIKKLSDLFVKRLELMTAYIENVYNKFEGKYWIRSTGSDPHKDGQHALFLVNKESGSIEHVYKPHDLKPDEAVVGETGMFSKVNKLIENEFDKKCKDLGLGENVVNALATMKINVNSNTENFVKKEKEMIKKEAELYFFRAGIMKALTDAIAAIDLHCDNIMPTKAGPIIIDAEIDFFQYGENSGFKDGLGTDSINGKNANSTFIIKNGDEKEKDIPSGKAFTMKKSPYYQKYVEGFNFMIEQMQSEGKKDSFVAEFGKQLEEINKVRIIPLPTDEFAGILRCAATCSAEEKAIKADQLALNISKKLNNNGKFLDNEKIEVKLEDEDNTLKPALLKTFENGTIPALYADMDGNIYLDDEKIGKIVSKVAGNDIKIVDPIDRKQMIEIMKECFKKIVSNFKPIKTSVESSSDSDDVFAGKTNDLSLELVPQTEPIDIDKLSKIFDSDSD